MIERFGIIRALAVLVVVSLAAVALAAPSVAPAGGARPEAATSDSAQQRREDGASQHGWVIVPQPSGGVRLVHLPARGIGPNGSGLVRVVRDLASVPTAIAAWDDRVALVFQEIDADREATPARVGVIRAVRVGPEGWMYEPGDRLAPLAPPPDGRVIGAAGTSTGPAVLLEVRADDGDSAAHPSVLNLARWDGSAWASVRVQTSAGDAPDPASSGLHAVGDALIVLERRDGAAPRAWTQAGAGWQASPASDVLGGARIVVGSPDGLVALRDVEGSTEVWLANGEGSWRLAAVDGVAPGSACLVLHGMGASPDRAVLFTTTGEGERRLIEVSLETGMVLYDGEPRQPASVSVGMFRLLAVVLLVGMAGVLVLVVSVPNAGQELVLPVGCALAEPGRRLSASLIDLGLVALVASKVFSTPMVSIVTGMALVDPSAEWVAVPATIGLGLLAGTIGEWLIGASPGKFLLGCRVVREGIEVRRVPFARCLGRNCVKWLLPPVAAMAMVEHEGRHRGDVLTRSIVVVPVASE